MSEEIGFPSPMTEVARIYEQLHERIEPTSELCLQRCGSRCCQSEHYIILTGEEVTRLRGLKADLQVRFRPWPTWAINFADYGGTCPFFGPVDGLGEACTIYDVRPEGCRSFPVAPEAGCLAWPK